MKNTFLLFVVSSSLLLWFGNADAAAPRFDSWGSWDNQTPPSSDSNVVVSAADETSAEAEKPTAKDKKDKKTVSKDAKQASTTDKPAPAPKTAVVPVPATPQPATSLGPPTKGRHISTSSDDDRSMPTPDPRITVIKGKHAKTVDKEENLSWWERWKRRRKGIPLKPIFIPNTHVYTVRMQEGQWRVKSTRLECQLSQDVPHLGQALFQQKVGSALEFKLQLSNRYEQIHQASFESIPPTWGHQRHKQAMALKASVHQASLTVQRTGALRLINELTGGMEPRVTYRMGADESSDAVEVNLSALTFADQLAKFQHCIDNLLPYQFDEVKESIVYFNFDSAKLTAKAQKALTKVAEYVRLDIKVKRIVIAGYTDSKGFRRYNYRLATQRARAVEKFFLAHGITKSRLSLSAKAFGEKQPAASNKSAEGRAQNRRVHVTLYK